MQAASNTANATAQASSGTGIEGWLTAAEADALPPTSELVKLNRSKFDRIHQLHIRLCLTEVAADAWADAIQKQGKEQKAFTKVGVFANG
jgi:hypothetical protein